MMGVNMRRNLSFLAISALGFSGVVLAPSRTVAASPTQCPAATSGQTVPSPGAPPAIAIRRAASGVIGAPAPRSTQPPASQDGFKQKLDRIGWKYDVLESGNYRVVFNVGGTKRTQLLYISGGTQSYDCLIIREFFAPAAKVSTSVNGAKALELMAESHTKKIGSWEIHGDTLMYTAIQAPCLANNMAAAGGGHKMRQPEAPAVSARHPHMQKLHRELELA